MMLRKWLNQDRFPVMDKLSDTEVVAYIQFKGLHEVAKHIWKLRDWINANDLHMVGAPSCVMQFAPNMGALEAESVPCEVQWRVADAPRPGVNGVGLKVNEPQRVLSTFHLGDTEAICQTFQFLEQVMTTEGYHTTGLQREVYLFDIGLPKSRWITECQISVVK